MFELVYYPEAAAQYEHLRNSPALRARYKAVTKALRLLAENPRHPGLQTHAWQGTPCPHKKTLFEAYAQNRTPGAYRIFFCYDPDSDKRLCIVAITPHP